jgi:hypothetical protein
VSRSSLLLAEHPDDEARRVLVRAKGNLAGNVPTLEFRISGHVFELNGHTFDQPHAVDWKESTVTTGDVLRAKRGRPRDEDARGKVESALSTDPQSVRKLAATTGVSKSTVQDILSELAECGAATKGTTGWLAGCPEIPAPRFPDT